MALPTRTQLAGGSPTLRQLCTCNNAPARVANVVRAIPAKESLVDVPLDFVANRWAPIRNYLMSRRAFGETSWSWVQEAVKAWLTENPASLVDQPTDSDPPPSGETLRDFCLANLETPARIRNYLLGGDATQECWKYTIAHAVKRWGEVETALLDERNLGSRSLRDLRDLIMQQLQEVASKEFDGNSDLHQRLPLEELAHRLDSPVPVRIRNAIQSGVIPEFIRELSGAQALARWNLVQSTLEALPAIGEGSCDQLRSNLANLAPLPLDQEHVSPTDASDSEADSKRIAGLLDAKSTAAILLPDEIVDHVCSAIGPSDSIQDVLQLRDEDNAHPSPLDSAKLTLMQVANEAAQWLTVGEDGTLTSSKALDDRFRSKSSSLAYDDSVWVALYALYRQGGTPYTVALVNLSSGNEQEAPNPLCLFHSPRALRDVSTRKAIVGTSSFLTMFAIIRSSSIPVALASTSPSRISKILFQGTSERDEQVLRTRADSTTNATLQETGEHFGITRERVRQIELKWRRSAYVTGLASFLGPFISSTIEEACELPNKFHDATTLFREGLQEKSDIDVIAYALGQTTFRLISALTIFANGRAYPRRVIDEENQDAIAFTSELLADAGFTQGLATRVQSDRAIPSLDSLNLTPAVRESELTVMDTTAGPWLCRGKAKASNRLQAAIDTAFLESGGWFLSDQDLYHYCLRCSWEDSPISLWRRITSIIPSGSIRRLSRTGWVDLRVLRDQGHEQGSRASHLADHLPLVNIDDGLGTSNQRRQLHDMLRELRVAVTPTIMDSWKAVSPTGNGNGAPFLLDDPYFSVVHPGHYGCLDEDSKFTCDIARDNPLNNRRELTQYLRMRQAGYAPNDFSAWTPAQLQEWVDLAKRDVSRAIRHSVVDQLEQDAHCHDEVTAWHPCDPALANELEEDCRQQLHAALPKPDHIIDILLFGLRFGFVNYYVVNCMVGRQWYSHKSISWLAWLTAAGAISAPRHWQGRFEMQNRGRDILIALLQGANESPDLAWTTSEYTRSLCKEVGIATLSVALPDWMPENERVAFAEVAKASATPGETPKLASYTKTTSRSLRVLPSRDSDTATAEYLDPFLAELIDD